MKRYLLSAILVVTYLSCAAVAKTWVGVSGANWSTPANWSPSGTPGSLDDVTFNTGTTLSVIIDIGVGVNSITITNSSIITFQSPVSRTVAPTSTSTLNPALKIDVGSTLTIDCTNAAGTNNFILDLANGIDVIGTIDGTLVFSCSGGSTSGAARLNTFTGALSRGIVTVGSTGYIKYNPNTGNTTSSSTSLIMQGGSTYELARNFGSIPDGIWAPTSLVYITGAVSNNISFNGASYGNFELNSPGMSFPLGINKDISFNNFTLTNTGTNFVRAKSGTGAITFTLSINGNLLVSSLSVLETSGSTTTSGAPGIVSVKGDIINNGIIRETSTVTGNQFQLTGTANQGISGTGSWTGDDFTFVMNNSAGATLLSPLTLPYNLQLTSGKITTTAANLLTMLDNATYTGGSTTSFINGPMKKIGNDNFIFPIGTGSIYTPIGIINVSGEIVTDEFTAEYLRTNPQSVHGTAVQSGQDHVSLVEYWTLAHSGAATKQISLAVNYTSFCYDLSKTYVSRWDATGPFWTNQNATFVSGPASPPLVSGTITSTTPVSSYGDFTLITDLIPDLNPLPVKLVDFTAKKISNSISSISWELATCCTATTKFELEKSTDGSSFVKIKTIAGNETNRLYTALDNRLATAGITYYRLRIKDADGKSTLSRIVAVINNDYGLLITSLWPNPVQDNNANLTITAASSGKVLLSIYDLSGKKINEWQTSVAEGSNTIPVKTDRLAPGIYHIVAKNGAAIAVMRFIKR